MLSELTFSLNHVEGKSEPDFVVTVNAFKGGHQLINRPCPVSKLTPEILVEAIQVLTKRYLTE